LLNMMSGRAVLAVAVSFAFLAGASPVAISAADVMTGWGTVTLVEYDDAGSAMNPRVAVDGSGNAIAVWHQQDGVRNHIWSNRYVFGVGWGHAEVIEDEPYASAVYPQVAVDAEGNAFAVWEQTGAAGFDIWSNRYVVGEGWGDAELVEHSNMGSAENPKITVDESGNAMAVWAQVDSYQQSVWSNIYTVAEGWGVPELVEANDTAPSFRPCVVLDSSGNAIAVWEQWGGSAMTIWSNRYVVGEGWGETEVVDTGDITGSFNPSVAVDASGNALVVWERWDGTFFSISANRYVVGVGWGDAETIETGNAGDALTPEVAMTGSGDAIAVWSQTDSDHLNIWSNRYEVGTGWGTAEKVGADSTGFAGKPQIGSDGHGNAIVVWTQWDGAQNDILSNRYAACVGWGAPEMIIPDGWSTAANPHVAVDGMGNAIALFQVYDGTRYNMWSNRYVARDTTPPTLSLDSPSDGATTETPTVVASGTTEPGSILNVNGLLVAVDPDGSFSCAIALTEGVNIITATASDASGNSVTVTVNVTYVDPVPALEVQLNETQDELNDLQDELDQVVAELTNTSEELDAVRNDLADASEDLSETTEELDALREVLADTEDELNDRKSQNLMLIVALVVFATLALAMSVMYFNLRRKTGRPGNDITDDDTRPPLED